jgi:hypothetical protein
MKLVHKLAIVALMLSGAAQVQADANSILQGVSTTRKNTTAGKPAVVPSRAPISDQAAGGILTSNRTATPPKSAGVAANKSPAKTPVGTSGR